MSGDVDLRIARGRIRSEHRRPFAAEHGEDPNDRNVVEVACEVKLRDKYNLRDGDVVSVEILDD